MDIVFMFFETLLKAVMVERMAISEGRIEHIVEFIILFIQHLHHLFSLIVSDLQNRTESSYFFILLGHFVRTSQLPNVWTQFERNSNDRVICKESLQKARHFFFVVRTSQVHHEYSHCFLIPFGFRKAKGRKGRQERLFQRRKVFL